ncbi:hypothetical protein GW793_02615 [bacterium]|uniref:Regulatory protein RecX n=2 Tax=Katanobacteria TaxID=422282 RepID=A0A2M7X1D7_UNCKA|nr:hypothetical protein [bacterium]PIP56565.1 MAG: hypothetical protein COX05_02525 [candidate division WWE3 bacterium CG22_combo_CG10-13_8_21_14_all_39_12]PJA39899.1 MAG: hypothetical protein CO179_04010 [candidate division WWE3 bacterium CG_4_9_14_3_um_filter_39_7]
MPKITSISVQKKNKSRYNIFVDDEFFTGIDEDTLIRLHIKKGDELEPSDLSRIQDESDFGAMFNKSLDYLSRRPRSSKEIHDHMSEKMYKRDLFKEPDEKERKEQFIERIIHKLMEYNYVNDEEFVKWWIEQRTSKNKPSGLRRITSELMQKGISSQLTKRVWMEESQSDTENISTHAQAVKGKYDLTDEKQKTRLVNYLKRRGYSWEAIKTVLQ